MSYVTTSEIMKIDLHSQETKDFLKKGPEPHYGKERDKWFKLTERIGKNKDYFYKIICDLGYDTSLVGYKDKETKKAISFYSPSYARKKNEQEGYEKYKSRFKTADSYNNFKHKVICEQDNFGFIQKELSDVLWIDLDCHDDALIKEYNKIKTAFHFAFHNSCIEEEKNNKKGTHIWLFLSEKMTKQERKSWYKVLLLAMHINLQIDLDICKKIIDYPKSWFRVPGTKDYRETEDGMYYYDLFKKIEYSRRYPLTKEDYEYYRNIVITAFGDTSKQTKTVSNTTSVEVNKNDNTIRISDSEKQEIINRVLKNGLSRHSSFQEMSVVMPYLIQKHGKQPVEFFVDMLKMLGDGNGTADILFNESELKSRIQYFLENHNLVTKAQWRTNLTEEQKDFEKFALDVFISENKQLCETNNITRQRLLDLIDTIIDKYLLVKPPFKFLKLCGNLSATSIVKELGLPKEIFGVCTKIQNLFSNLYGFYQVIDEQGKFFIPGKASSRFICCKNGNILIGDKIYPYIADSISEFKENIKYIRINNLKPKQAVIKSISSNEEIDYVSTEQNENARSLLKKEKNELLKRINPKGVRKSKEDYILDKISENKGV